MTSVLVTGASGFIGKHLVPVLREHGYEVVSSTRAHGDVADRSTWTELPRTDTVVHLAGESFVPRSWAEPAVYLRANVLGTVNALEHCREHGARLVFLSSYLYGQPTRLPIPETAPLDASNPYALSKKLAEDACRFYAERLDLKVTVLRPFNVYGFGQADEFLIPSLIRQITRGTEIFVQDLEPRRDYIYICDVVLAIVKAVATDGGYRVLNVGAGTSHSVDELISTLQHVWGSALPVRSACVRRQGEVMDTVADIEAAHRMLGWWPQYTLETGLSHLRSVLDSQTARA
jgi:GDP-4-dehydro-6-deoxy-D-mannose reductase